jgi:hypothetical protein
VRKKLDWRKLSYRQWAGNGYLIDNYGKRSPLGVFHYVVYRDGARVGAAAYLSTAKKYAETDAAEREAKGAP